MKISMQFHDIFLGQVRHYSAARVLVSTVIGNLFYQSRIGAFL